MPLQTSSLLEKRVAELRQLKQDHLLAQWDQWTLQEQTRFLEQTFDTALVEKEIAVLHRGAPGKKRGYGPAVAKKADRKEGWKWIKEGELALLVVAGGQGSRLGLEGTPKGAIPVSPVKGKSLFQLLAEKVVAASQRAKRPLFMAVMTSPANDQQVRQFFKDHYLFGLQEEQLDFFCQEEYPFLDDDARCVLDQPGHIAVGPNGNGLALIYLRQSGILEKWKEKGVRYLHWVPIDNPLADPFDHSFFAFHKRHGFEVSLKGVERLSLKEAMGLVVQSEGKVAVIEYHEASDLLKEQPLLGNAGLYCFSVPFVERLKKQHFPLHCQKKAVKIFGEWRELWKFEHYIFDALALTSQVGVWQCQRCDTYAPLKDSHSLEEVKRALEARDRRFLEALGEKVEGTIELEPAVYYTSSKKEAMQK